MDTKEIAKISIDRFAEQLRKSEAVLFWQYLDENPGSKQMLTGRKFPLRDQDFAVEGLSLLTSIYPLPAVHWGPSSLKPPLLSSARLS